MQAWPELARLLKNRPNQDCGLKSPNRAWLFTCYVTEPFRLAWPIDSPGSKILPRATHPFWKLPIISTKTNFLIASSF